MKPREQSPGKQDQKADGRKRRQVMETARIGIDDGPAEAFDPAFRRGSGQGSVHNEILPCATGNRPPNLMVAATAILLALYC